ncbi:hypothetical protein BC832DRAFT_107625 [Gaertneriomyces semiglobifer]|nr:hypothetical protein BC832DRAFT_107625 [Gaertneriomyces semiglobifer]
MSQISCRKGMSATYPSSSSTTPANPPSSTATSRGPNAGARYQNPSRAGQQASARPRKQEQRSQRKGKGPVLKEPSNVTYTGVTSRDDDFLVDEEFMYPTPNKRGQISLNHLLNFHMPPRQRPTNTRTTARRRTTTAYTPFNKERFVNANFRFVMNCDGDYTINLHDPDTLVDWDQVVQTIVPSVKNPSCPICLGKPVAPRATKCGHVYCFACVLHYLALGDRKWRKCPICYDAIYAKDLRPARFWIMESQPEPGDNSTSLEMTLMKRLPNSSVALPRTGFSTWSEKSRENKPPSVVNSLALPFSKLLLSTPEYEYEDVFLQDLAELQRALKECEVNENLMKERRRVMVAAGQGSDGEKDGGERIFVEGALKDVKERLDALEAKFAWLKGRRNAENRKDESRLNLSKEPPDSSNAHFETAVDPASPALTALPNIVDAKEDHDHAPSNNPTQVYYFYQSAAGHHLYLHPLDIKILKQHYETYESFPDRLTVIVQRITETTMDEGLRKRCRYLSHVPIGGDVGFVEVDYGATTSSPVGADAGECIIGPATRTMFEKELNERQRRVERERMERQVQEESAGLLASMREALRYGTDNGSPGVAGGWGVVEETYEQDFPSSLMGTSPGSDAGSATTDTSLMQRSDKIAPSDSSTNKDNSFAKIAAASSASSRPWKPAPVRAKPRSGATYDSEDEYYYNDDEYHGWTLDFEEAVLVDGGGANQGSRRSNAKGGISGGGGGGGKGAGKAGKAKKVLLVSNAGGRGRL